MSSRGDIEARVRDVVAGALDRSAEEVRPHSSLIDDLGAESIDFLDIAFRLESEFRIKIPDEEIWRGEFDLAHAGPEERRTALRELRDRMPEFHWERFPDGIGEKDLPRLITVRTIVDYLDRVLRERSVAP